MRQHRSLGRTGGIIAVRPLAIGWKPAVSTGRGQGRGRRAGGCVAAWSLASSAAAMAVSSEMVVWSYRIGLSFIRESPVTPHDWSHAAGHRIPAVRAVTGE